MPFDRWCSLYWYLTPPLDHLLLHPWKGTNTVGYFSQIDPNTSNESYSDVTEPERTIKRPAEVRHKAHKSRGGWLKKISNPYAIQSFHHEQFVSDRLAISFEGLNRELPAWLASMFDRCLIQNEKIRIIWSILSDTLTKTDESIRRSFLRTTKTWTTSLQTGAIRLVINVLVNAYALPTTPFDNQFCSCPQYFPPDPNRLAAH